MTIDQLKTYKVMLSGLTNEALEAEVTAVAKQCEALLMQLTHNECAIRDRADLFLSGYKKARQED